MKTKTEKKREKYVKPVISSKQVNVLFRQHLFEVDNPQLLTSWRCSNSCNN